MTAEYPVGTVARVRVGEWEGRALRDNHVWRMAGHPRLAFAYDLTVLAVELPAPVTEPKAFGARVEHGPEDDRNEAVLVAPGLRYSWQDESGNTHAWMNFFNPVVLHDPEVDR